MLRGSPRLKACLRVTARLACKRLARLKAYGARGVAERLPIAVLVSGTGTNLQALLDTVHGREAEVVAVASSKAGVKALERAAQSGVPTAVFARGDYPDRRARD